MACKTHFRFSPPDFEIFPEAVVQARLVEYHKMTEPLKDFYDKLGKLAVVEGQEEVADTTALVFAALED